MNSQAGWFISEYSVAPTLSVSPSLPLLPPSLHPFHVPQCKIWARQPYKSGREIMRVGPLSPVGHQPGSVPMTSSSGGASGLMSAVTPCHCFWIRRTPICTCTHTSSPFRCPRTREKESAGNVERHLVDMVHCSHEYWFSFSKYLLRHHQNVIKFKWNYCNFPRLKN